MTDEDVKHASKDYVNYLLDKQEYHNEKYTEYDIREAFEKGAKWAEGHLKNVWHLANEVPNENTSIVFIWYGNLIHKLEIIPNVDKSFYSWLTANRYIKQWAYIDDILPKGGEE